MSYLWIFNRGQRVVVNETGQSGTVGGAYGNEHGQIVYEVLFDSMETDGSIDGYYVAADLLDYDEAQALAQVNGAVNQ